MCVGQVAMLKEKVGDDLPNWVWPCRLDFNLGNWQSIEQLKISVLNLM